MPLFKVSGYYNVTKYVERIVEAENEDEAEHKAWSCDYVDEIETGYDEDDFEVTGETEEIE